MKAAPMVIRRPKMTKVPVRNVSMCRGYEKGLVWAGAVKEIKWEVKEE